MFVNCCHCRWCQRETGSAFALNAIIETDRIELSAAAPDLLDTPSHSGKGQKIARCPSCQIAVWSHYPGAGPALAFVRVGTLGDPDCCPPDAHIFTSTRQAWVQIAPGVPVLPEYYDRNLYWPAASLARREAVLAKAAL